MVCQLVLSQCWSVQVILLLKINGCISPIISRGHSPEVGTCKLWFLQSNHQLLFDFSLILRFRGCITDIPVGVRYLQSLLVYVVWSVQVSVIVSICWERNCDEGWELYFSDDIFSRGSPHFKNMQSSLFCISSSGLHLLTNFDFGSPT